MQLLVNVYNFILREFIDYKIYRLGFIVDLAI